MAPDRHLFIIVVRWLGCPGVVAKEIRIQLGLYCLETTWPSVVVEAKKASQVSSGKCVGKPERALPETENTLDEPQDAAEIMLLVIDVLPGRESRDNDQGYAQTILVITLNAMRCKLPNVTPAVPASRPQDRRAPRSP